MKTIEEKKSKAPHFAVKSAMGDMVVKDVDSYSRTVTGFFSTFNMVDSDGDILMAGCANKSIKERGPASKAVAKIKHCMNHDMTTMPGKIITLEEKTIGNLTGIYFETKMADTECGNDCLKNYMAGVYDNHSIGFQYLWEKIKAIEVNTPQWDEMMEYCMNPKDLHGRTYVYQVKEIKLWEGSTVAFGANMMTPFLGMKSGLKADVVLLELDTRMKKLEAVLKSGTQTDDMMEKIEVMHMQLKQFMSELLDQVTFKNPKEDIKPDPQPEQKGIDYGGLLQMLK